jgi:hypothetical protein
MKNGLLIWWSNNSRAESVLARIAMDSGLPLGIVISESLYPPAPQILKYAHIYYRGFSETSLTEIESLASKFKIDSESDRIVLAPTSEYILDLISEFRSAIFDTPINSILKYRNLSSKSFMAEYFSHNRIIKTPLDGPSVLLQKEFIAKPKYNVIDGKVLKPFKVDSPESRDLFNGLLNSYFPQEYISPPSFYWCAYRSKTGEICSYFQRNLLQEDNGGSIVCAELGSPPNAIQLKFSLENFLERINFLGPMMIELRGSEQKFIELNPRFWGPLLLSLSLPSNPVRAFFEDMFNTQPNLTAFQRLGSTYTVPILMHEDNRIVNVADDIQTYHSRGSFENAISAGIDFSQLGGHW